MLCYSHLLPLRHGCSQVVLFVVLMVRSVAVMMMTTVKVIVEGLGRNNDYKAVDTLSNVFSVFCSYDICSYGFLFSFSKQLFRLFSLTESFFYKTPDCFVEAFIKKSINDA